MSQPLIRIEVLISDDCPNTRAGLQLVDEIVGRLNIETIIDKVQVDTEARAAALHFLGSPSIQVNSEDIEGRSTNQGSLACRIYGNGRGVPDAWMLEAALLRARRPKGLLLMCVANSARSQIAEGLARSLAPKHTRIFSAGSEPSQIRPEAIAVLGEIGIDASTQYSKSVNDINKNDIDAVLTLCAEEVCPTYLGQALRLHWGLADPAAETDPERRMQAFRQVRDVLQQRFELLFRPQTREVCADA